MSLDCKGLIIASVTSSGDVALAQVCFERGTKLVRCRPKIAATAGLGHELSSGSGIVADAPGLRSGSIHVWDGTRAAYGAPMTS